MNEAKQWALTQAGRLWGWPGIEQSMTLVDASPIVEHRGRVYFASLLPSSYNRSITMASPKKTPATKLATRRRVAAAKVVSDADLRVEKVHRDWVSMLIPICITIVLSLGAQIVTGIWQGATFKSQVNAMDQHQKTQDEAIKTISEKLQQVIVKLPQDYMPREEILENRERTKEMRDLTNNRLDKLDNKMDLILANQAHAR